MIRRRARTGLSANLRSILKMVPDGVLILGPDRRVVDANSRAVDIFGRSVAALKGGKISELIETPSGEALPRSAPVGPRRVHPGVVRGAGQSTRRVEVRTSKLGTGALTVCFIRDVTQDARRRSERVLNSVLLDEAVSVGRIGAWHLDTVSEVITWSPELRRMMEVSPRKATLTVADSYRFYTPASRAIVKEAFDLAVAHGTPYDLELEAVTARGRSLWVREACRTTMRRGRLFSLVGISQDITERRQLTQLLADAADHERVRLGADLHDGICQELTGLSMLLDSHAKNDGVVSPMASTLRELAVIARTTATNARALAHGMLPVDLRQGGLGAALRRLAQPLARVPAVAIVVEMTAEAEQLIDQRIGEQFFRIAQEAVSNAVRHGQARGITLRVEAVGSKAVLTVTDNGIGIAAKSNAAGLGLRTMAYRARLLGGLLTTRRLPHGGTRVRCVVPTEHASRPDDTSLEATM